MKEELLKEIQEEKSNTRYSSSAHFIASIRYKRYSNYLGGFIIPISTVLSSALAAGFASSDNTKLSITFSIITLLSAVLVSIKEYYNFDKKVISHHNSGNRYLNMNKKLSLLEVKYNSNLIDDNEASNLYAEYLSQLEDISNNSLISSEKDFNAARDKINSGDFDHDDKDRNR